VSHYHSYQSETEFQKKTHAVVRFAKKHQKKAAWGTTVTAIVTLAIQAISQHFDSQKNHQASSERINQLQTQVNALEREVQKLEDDQPKG